MRVKIRGGTVRYGEPEKLAWERAENAESEGSVPQAEGGVPMGPGAPRDDRGLPDLHFAYYDGAVVFDHVDKIVHVVRLAHVPAGAGEEELGRIFERARTALEQRVDELHFLAALRAFDPG